MEKQFVFGRKPGDEAVLEIPSVFIPIAQSICRVLAMQAYRYGRLGEALSWCLRVKVSGFTHTHPWLSDCLNLSLRRILHLPLSLLKSK